MKRQRSCSWPCKTNPALPPTYRFLAACYAHMGRLDEAREIVERLRTITSVVVPSTTPYRNPEDRKLFLTGLRLAMGGGMSRPRRPASIIFAGTR